jgi:hypothetical protein
MRGAVNVMNRIKTNRDLYLALGQLIKKEKENERSLESYLLALLNLGKNMKHRKVLTLDEFIYLLTIAFSGEPLIFDEAWKKLEYQRDLEGFAAWQNTLIHQIVNLREMAEKGTLNDNMRHFGIDVPRGSRWYNFEPGSFLEAGMVSTFGGWQEGDATGRDYVPGPVAVLGEGGKIESVDPRDIDDPITELKEISWEEFQHFLFMGQIYE